eukprot:NODE_4298_length_324_cov_40.010909_g4216_i0.p1 GENE.NODE_4298_length_324_cov_40.010909_g4216_i0~~NODE_4298_length_324_cov_40.010909_g4216_i0.p1  ORF type:complete len:73 (-),score=4.78 NODE_4298_length_324_cov_40.010909_g4216_i0:27-245(-)
MVDYGMDGGVVLWCGFWHDTLQGIKNEKKSTQYHTIPSHALLIHTILRHTTLIPPYNTLHRGTYNIKTAPCE